MKTSVSESQSHSCVKISGQARQEERLSRSKLNRHSFKIILIQMPHFSCTSFKVLDSAHERSHMICTCWLAHSSIIHCMSEYHSLKMLKNGNYRTSGILSISLHDCMLECEFLSWASALPCTHFWHQMFKGVFTCPLTVPAYTVCNLLLKFTEVIVIDLKQGLVNQLQTYSFVSY